MDYTSARVAGGEDHEVVRSYMSHHLGMSLVAMDNVLRDNVMQKRFMRDCDMSAYRELIQERVPVGAPVMKQEERDFPARPRPNPGPALERRGEDFGRRSPRCHLAGGGSYSVLACDNGLTASRAGELAVTLARPGAYYAPAGVSAFFNGPEGLVGLTPAPLYQREGRYSWEFHAGGAVWSFEGEGLSARFSLSVPRRERGELRRVELTAKKRLEGELLFYLEPVLCPQRDFDAHPAFSRLFLECALEEGGALFRRRPRGEEETPCLFAAWTGEGTSACLDRSAALGRGGLRALPGRVPGPLEDRTGSDPCLMVRIPVSLAPGKRLSHSLALVLGDTPAAAREGARRAVGGQEGGPVLLSALAQKLASSIQPSMEAVAQQYAADSAAMALPEETGAPAPGGEIDLQA